jgi:hypothetical protein
MSDEQTKPPTKVTLIRFLIGIHVGFLSVFIIWFFVLFGFILTNETARTSIAETGKLNFKELQQSLYQDQTLEDITYEEALKRDVQMDLKTDPKAVTAEEEEGMQLDTIYFQWVIFGFIYILANLAATIIGIHQFRKRNFSIAGFLILIAGALSLPIGILALIGGGLIIRLDPEVRLK